MSLNEKENKNSLNFFEKKNNLNVTRKSSFCSFNSYEEEVKTNSSFELLNTSICHPRKYSQDYIDSNKFKKSTEYEISSESYQYLKCVNRNSNESISEFNTIDSFSNKILEINSYLKICKIDNFQVLSKKKVIKKEIKNNQNFQTNQNNLFMPLIMRYQIMAMQNMYKKYENTEILEINVYILGKKLIFKLRRYDNLFHTVRLFCEINNLDNKYIKPLISYIIIALNSIYGIMNLKLNKEEIDYLKEIKNDNV